ncbi:MAG TPA: lytic transglycosylase domain-containing protein [Candidatus Solibacter sp.]|nr:lytic transglycosylase domain-containing protein [Candidatus Solibacter sp.]
MRHFCFTLMLAGCAILALPASGADQPQRYSSVVRPDLRTGKLVRSMVVASKAVNEQRVQETVVRPRVVNAAEPAPAPAPAPTGIDEAVERIASEHSLPPQLIHSVIKVESNYNPYAVSTKGAQGLMQLIPETARRFGVANAFNPIENIQGGARYLRYLLDLYEGNYPLALAAYNAGEGAVAKYGGIPPYAETQNYVIQVRKQLEAAKKAAAAKVPPPAPAKPAEPKSDGPAAIIEEKQPDGTVRYISR